MSEVANEKRNWLEEVKAESEAITRARLAQDLPRQAADSLARQEARKVETLKEASRSGLGQLQEATARSAEVVPGVPVLEQNVDPAKESDTVKAAEGSKKGKK